MTLATVTEALGGAKALRSPAKTDTDLRQLTRKGLPVGSVAKLAKQLQVSEERVAQAAGISSRTFSRRRSHDARMTQAESDRLVEIARTLAYAVDVLGSMNSARGWMLGHVPALNGEVPLNLMDTSAGVREVNTILGRIAYGIFS